MKYINTSKVTTELRTLREWSSLPDDSEIACYQVSKSDAKRYHLRGSGASLRYVAYASERGRLGWQECKAYFGLPDTVRYLVVLDEDFVSRAMALGDLATTKLILRDTIIHELGHILQFGLKMRGGHDEYFHHIMRLAGAPELRYCGRADEQVSPSCPMTWGEFFEDFNERD